MEYTGIYYHTVAIAVKMLASQMASVSEVMKTTFHHQATLAPTTAIAWSTRLPRKCHYQQQTRGFRIGLWSSYLDPAFQKELQRRHRIIKHKYAEALIRKLSWDRRLPVYATRWGVKRLMCTSWRAHDPRPGGRWVNVDELKEVRDDANSAGRRGIDEAEQAAVNKAVNDTLDEFWGLFSRRDTQRSNYRDGPSTSADPADKTTRSMPEARTSESPGSRYDMNDFETAATSSSEQEYDIDPISNRKVFRKTKTQAERLPQTVESAVTEIRVKTFKGYRSQFSKFEPPAASFESKVIHLDGGVSSHTPPIQPTAQTVQDEADKYKPFKYNEPDGKLPDQGDAATQMLRLHDHLYKPFKYNEPDGKVPEKPDKVSECLSDFDHQYKPFKYNEPDGKLPEKSDPVENCLNEYDQQNGSESQPSSSTISRSDSQQPRTNSHSNQGSNRGELQSTNSWLSQEGFSSSTRIGRRERAATQPCEQSQANATEPSIDRLSQSRISTVNKDDADTREDLDLLRASDIRASSGILKEPRKETQAERDIRRTSLEKDFGQIQNDQSTLADEIAAAQKVKASRQLAQELEIKRSYLLNHNAHARGRVDAKIAELDAEIAAEKARSDAQKKMTGNFVRDFPEEFSTSWSPRGSSTNACLVPKNDTDAWGYDKSPKGLELSYQQEIENSVQSAENDYVSDITTPGDGSSQGNGSQKLETALHRSLKEAQDRIQAEHDPYTKEPKGLETSYAKEVEEQGNCVSPLFVKSYGCEKRAQQDRGLVRDIRNIYESTYGTIDCNHRQSPEGENDAETSRQEGRNNGLQATIQNLEQEVREGQYQVHERYKDVAKALAKQSSPEEQTGPAAVDSSSALKEPPKAASPPEPTLYKILAYDPILQTIKMAETTSAVTDSSSALTPAEVLLRLSNPAKFFPHFQPLQSEGYEIASGSGDVLVFRKVREGTPIASLQPSPESTAASATHGRKVVNPIDGMQSVPQPATGNFASPTGFVNHDLPSEHPFISGIDVRREEPVFSGRRTEWQDGEDEKEGAGRKSKKVGRGLLIGAAWVAACSYAIGVVAEFFKTGGSDGKGPVGF